MNSMFYSRPAVFTELAKLFTEFNRLQSAQLTQAEDPDEALRSIDFEEQGAGYQAAYSKLAASESVAEDPVAYVSNPRTYLGQQLSAATQRNPKIRALIEASVTGVVDERVSALVQGLVAEGHQF